MNRLHRNYCTYFDSRFLARGVVMLRSLQRVDPGSTIHVLALDRVCARVLCDLFGSRLRVIEAETFLAGNPDLRALHGQRSTWAFYATLKPAFVLFVLRGSSRPPTVTHIDADTWFFNDPEAVYEEIGSASIALTPHRFHAQSQHLAIYGAYNAGCAFWRGDDTGLRCLEEWRNECAEWCHEDVQADGRFMNQGYLNRWPDRYPDVHVISNPGVNLATWNVGGHLLERRGNRIEVDHKPLIFYHYSGVRLTSDGCWRSMYPYMGGQREFILGEIYEPYFDAVAKESREIMSAYGVPGTVSVCSQTTSRGAVVPGNAQKTKASSLPRSLFSELRRKVGWRGKSIHETK